MGETPEALAKLLEEVHSERADLFARRYEIAALAEHPRLDTWFTEVLALAASLAQQPSA